MRCLNIENWLKVNILLRDYFKAAQPNFRKLFNLKDIQSRCACSQKILIQFFSYGIMPLLIIEIWQKLNILLKQFSSAAPLKPLHKTSCYFIVKVDILCICAYLREILIWFFFLENILIVKNKSFYIIWFSTYTWIKMVEKLCIRLWFSVQWPITNNCIAIRYVQHL